MSIIERIKDATKESNNPSEILSQPLNPSKPEEELLSILSSSDETKADLSFAGLTLGDLIYDTMRLDPRVVEGIDFAKTEDLGGLFQLKFAANYDTLKDIAPGEFTRLKGYVGERFVASELQSQGMEVEFPPDPNQAGYDLLVNGDEFQVKCVADISSVSNHFEKYPDIPVFINEEIFESLEDMPNVYPVNGFSLEAVENSTRETIEAGGEVLDYEIPLIALSVAIGKNAYSFFRGKTDLKHGTINVAYDAVGFGVGGELGSSGLALLGSLLGPYGVVVGGLLGAVGGASYGRRALSKAKRFIHTFKEEELVEYALMDFIKDSYNSSKKSEKIFQKKTNDLIHNLEQKGDKAVFLIDYAKNRIKHEKNYLTDKIEQLKNASSNLDSLYTESDDIIVEGINAMSLSLRAKVHPHSVKKSMANLVDSMKNLQEKRSKL